MSIKKTFPFLISLLFVALMGCQEEASNVNNEAVEEEKNITESGMPIVKEPITLDFFARMSHRNLENDWNDILIWNEYEKMTNIKINWEQVSDDAIEERRNLLLLDDDLPDALYATQIPPLDILEYGERGVFIPLNDLIDEHAPNIKNIFEEYPEVRSSITFPDGNIYSLPEIRHPEFHSDMLGSTPLYNREWLEKTSFEIPETTDEFYEYLKAIKEQSNDVIPLGILNIQNLIGWLEGSFGVGNRAIDFIDQDPETGELRFYPISDGYKEMLKYINKLYEEELLDQNVFTLEHPDYTVHSSEGRYGSTVYWPSDERAEIYESGIALEGPNGDQVFSKLYNTVSGLGQFVITKNNEHPIETIRWIDYFYSDEGSKFFYLGLENVTYEEKEDGTLGYVDEIMNSPDGLVMNEEISKRLVWVGTGAPGIRKQEYFAGTEGSEAAIEAGEKMKPYFLDEENRWPQFLFTSEENEELTILATDIEKYTEEMRDKFIAGTSSFTEWDDYVARLERIGLDRYMEIYEAAYQRYINN